MSLGGRRLLGAVLAAALVTGCSGTPDRPARPRRLARQLGAGEPVGRLR